MQNLAKATTEHYDQGHLRASVLSFAHHRRFLSSFLTAVLAVFVCSSAADEWPAPEPVSFRSKTFGYVAEIFPPKSRQNRTEKALCYFYEVGYPGRTWDVNARLRWKAALVNSTPFFMPYGALISMDGDLVTLNEYGNLGYQNAVVIYNKNGNFLRTYALEELMPAGDMAKFQRSISSRWWNEKARYYFLKSPRRFYVVLDWGKILEFSLATGAFKSGEVKNFPDLSTVMQRKFPNEETEIWKTSLRFSSITDVLQVSNHQGSN